MIPAKTRKFMQRNCLDAFTVGFTPLPPILRFYSKHGRSKYYCSSRGFQLETGNGCYLNRWVLKRVKIANHDKAKDAQLN
eukprot:3015413-Amphidinium_carterae.1